MSRFEIVLPQMGESVAEATLVAWLKEVGDYVELDEPIVEIATDKVDSEVPSEFEGYLIEKRFSVDDVIQVGEVIAVIDSQAPGAQPTEKQETQPVPEPFIQQAAVATSTASEVAQSQAADVTSYELRQAELTAQQLEEQARQLRSSLDGPAAEPLQMDNPVSPESGSSAAHSNRFYSPLVRNIAREEGIGQEELDQIQGTGAEGRVTKDDLLAYLQRAQSPQVAPGTSPGQPSAAMPQEPVQEVPESPEHTDDAKTDMSEATTENEQVRESVEQTDKLPSVTRSGGSTRLFSGDEIIPLSRMGKLIAHHMKESVATSAHVQSFVEADVTRLVEWRKRVKNDFERREGEKLTFTPMFLEAVALALKKYPMMNISLEGESIIRKKRINLGMAAALPDGNLIVPVIKDADQLNLIGMAKQVNDLAHRARNNQLKPDEIKDGTYTVTNVGSFGSVFGTPIINQPQVGILALGAIRKVPAVIETESGDYVGIRSKMFLSHSYDHRVVNGALGGMFVKAVADYLENWDLDRSI